jgi:hypothetical protein
VVHDWLPKLLPGFFAGATHGPIRVTHAIRSLEEEENEIRESELAGALGYWASCFRRLPGEPGCERRPGRGPARILAQIPRVVPERRRSGFLTDAVGVLDEEPGFAPALASADLAAREPGELLSEICASAAGLYLANPSARIAYLHGITGPAALRLIATHLDENSLREGLGYALQSVSALHATHSEVETSAANDSESENVTVSWDELRYRAACSLEEHVIKLTEACWREDRIRPDSRLRLAATDAVLHLGVSSSGRGA